MRLATLRAAGELRIPMTTGLLIGIGETRRERIESLLALRDVHDEHGHLQELIIQNFRASPAPRWPPPPSRTSQEQLWTIAVARLLFGASDDDPGAAESATRQGSSVSCVRASTTGAAFHPSRPIT